MTENKPQNTNPSEAPVQETPTETPEKDPASQEAIGERVLEAVAKQQEKDTGNPLLPKEGEQKSKEEGVAVDVSTKEDSSTTDPSKEVLSLLSNITGRTYSDVDDAKKHINNLNSLVGDKTYAETRENARVLNQFAETLAKQEGVESTAVLQSLKEMADTGKLSQLFEKGKTEAPAPKEAEAPKEVAPKPEDALSKIIAEKSEPAVDSETLDRLQVLEEGQGRSDLLNKYPDAASVQDDVLALSRQLKVPQIAAYEKSFQSLVEAKKEEESRKSPVVTPSNKIGFDQNKVHKLAAQVLKSNKPEARQALVAEVLGLDR